MLEVKDGKVVITLEDYNKIQSLATAVDSYLYECPDDEELTDLSIELRDYIDKVRKERK